MSMYLEHFGLREAPFRITPHTEFFFSGANRGATLDALVYAVTHDEGIVKVSGEVGSGKTMLCRMLLEKLPQNVDTVYLANPSLSRDEIFHAIADELCVPLPQTRSYQVLRQLQERLIDIYAEGRQVVVLIDEAHAMPAESLEEIRLLSNLESNRHKLVHIVLFGQPELDLRLAEVGMRQLKERITHHFSLEPLHKSDVGAYLMFRLRAAGYRGPDLFTPAALRLIAAAAEGLTRRLNILADKALLAAFAENRHQVDAREAKAAIHDAQFGETPRPPRRRPLALMAAGLLVALAAFFAGRALVAPPPAVPPAAPGTAAASSAKPTPADANFQAQAPVSSEPAAPAATAGTQDTPAAANDFEARLVATQAWIERTPRGHYFIQLVSTDAANRDDVRRFLDTATGALDPAALRVYRSNLSGRDRLGVIYGDYPTRQDAARDLASLPRLSGAATPYVRSVGQLRP